MRLSEEEVNEAAGMLLRARQDLTPVTASPEPIRPPTFDDGYRIQDRLHDLGGWPIPLLKVGCTTIETQRMLDIDEPIGGRLPSHLVHQSGAELALARFHHRPLIECEFAMRLGASVAADAELESIETVLALTDAVAPAIELVDGRYEAMIGHDGPSIVADNSMAAAVILGDAVTFDDSLSPLDLADIQVELVTEPADDSEVERIAAGVGREVLGNPINSLAWALRHELRRGRSVRAGTWVITGSCAGAPPAPLDQPVTVRFARLGSVSVIVSTTGSTD